MRDLAAQVTSRLLQFPEVTIQALGEDETTRGSVLRGQFCRDMAGGDGYPASRLGSRADTLGYRMGPQRAKYEAERGKSSQRSSEVLKEILKDLDKAALEMDRETAENEALQEGGSHAVPVSDDRRGAIQSVEVPGVDGTRNRNAMDPKAFQKYCIEGSVAVVGSILLGMVFCCVIRLWRKRRRRLAAASRARPDTSSCPSHPDTWTAHPSTSKSWTQHQQPSHVPGKAAHQPRSTGGEPASTSPDGRPARPPPPRPKWLSNSASQVLQDRPSTLRAPEKRQPPPRPPSPLLQPSCKGLGQSPQDMDLGSNGECEGL
ncbi:uncharacterized protein LOC135317684 [Phalacrocorax carbo]|uniref:uncharacterized protein LOC135317684 n=1 Tax=Phalacrocorax carbo TaxID=9209 RepID=UPI0031199673